MKPNKKTLQKSKISPRLPMFLKTKHQFLLYASFLGIWLSGGVWVVLFYFGQIEGEFGLTPHPFAPLTLKIHGLFACVVWMALGSVLPAHIVSAWRLRRNLYSGLSFLIILFFLGFSGWYLYYADDEIWRKNTALLHWVMGAFLPLLIMVHVIFGRKARQRPPQ